MTCSQSGSHIDARHSDIHLTMGVYTQLDIEELGGAVEQLFTLIPLPSEKDKLECEETPDQQLADTFRLRWFPDWS